MSGSSAKHPDGSGLSVRERDFVDHYIRFKNKAAAAKAAGYHTDRGEFGFAQIGYLIAKRPKIKAEIERLLGEQSVKLQLTADRVLEELMLIAFADIGTAFDESGNLLDPPQMPEEIRRVISSIDQESDKQGNPKTKLKTWSKIEALGLLGKHLKLFTDLIEAKIEGLSDEERKARIAAILGAAKKRKSDAGGSQGS